MRGIHNMQSKIDITDGDMRLLQVEYAEIKKFGSLGKRERVSISDTSNTYWFQIQRDSELVGVCGLYLAAKKCRIKGDWILPQHRGKGLGEFITKCRLGIAKDMGYTLVEVLTLHPHYYEAKGFTIHKETRKGVWLASKEI